TRPRIAGQMQSQNRYVYLAGAIWRNANPAEWRRSAIELMPPGWSTLDPMLHETEDMKPEQLVQFDYGLIDRCSAIIVRVSSPSWGTAMELAYAKTKNIPVFAWSGFLNGVVYDNNMTCGELRKHPKGSNPWLAAHVTKFVSSLREACEELR